MKINQIMERAGMTETGRSIAYIKDGLEEIELYTKQNIVRGSLATTTGTGISFEKAPLIEDFKYSDYSYNTTVPPELTTAGWAEVTSSGSAATEFKISEKELYIKSAGVAVVGLKRTFSTIIGQTYHIAVSSQNIDTAAGMSVYVSNTDSTTYDLSGTISMGGVIDVGLAGLGTGSGTSKFYNVVRFTATATTTVAYISISTGGIQEAKIDYLKIFPGENALNGASGYHRMFDSNSKFSNFTTDMKIFIDGSSSFNTDKSENTSTGYYTPLEVASNYILIDSTNYSLTDSSVLDLDNSDDISLKEESAGNSITVRGQTINYMDIIKDKRFYPLPDDMLKLIDVKVKNHKNGNDKYRSVERMIYQPSEQDGDNV
tara:strand:+ start:1244 stop:2362 length:1119 start_codon:yes stop_codon:yes gene_type:complete